MLWRTKRQIGSGEFKSDTQPFKTDRFQKQDAAPLTLPHHTSEFNSVKPEVDSKGHSVDRMRTKDPIDMMRTEDFPTTTKGAIAVPEWKERITYSGGSNRLHLIRPFGPAIAEFMVRDDILEKSKSIVDYVYTNEYQDYTQHLAGVVEEEGYIPAKYWFPTGCGKYFEDAVSSYLVECIAASMMEGHMVPDSVIEAQEDSRPNIKTNSVWYNIMRHDEYNPLHYHTNCQVSGVYYINVPNIPRRPEIKFGQDAMDGNILMLDNNNNPQTNFCMGHVSKQPQEGMVYLFPSFMQHTVYPFRGPGERVSIAFNFTVEWGDKEIDPLVAARYRVEFDDPEMKNNPIAEMQNKRAESYTDMEGGKIKEMTNNTIQETLKGM